MEQLSSFGFFYKAPKTKFGTHFESFREREAREERIMPLFSTRDKATARAHLGPEARGKIEYDEFMDKESAKFTEEFKTWLRKERVAPLLNDAPKAMHFLRGDSDKKIAALTDLHRIIVMQNYNTLDEAFLYFKLTESGGIEYKTKVLDEFFTDIFRERSEPSFGTPLYKMDVENGDTNKSVLFTYPNEPTDLSATADFDASDEDLRDATEENASIANKRHLANKEAARQANEIRDAEKKRVAEYEEKAAEEKERAERKAREDAERYDRLLADNAKVESLALASRLELTPAQDLKSLIQAFQDESKRRAAVRGAEKARLQKEDEERQIKEEEEEKRKRKEKLEKKEKEEKEKFEKSEGGKREHSGETLADAQRNLSGGRRRKSIAGTFVERLTTDRVLDNISMTSEDLIDRMVDQILGDPDDEVINKFQDLFGVRIDALDREQKNRFKKTLANMRAIVRAKAKTEKKVQGVPSNAGSGGGTDAAVALAKEKMERLHADEQRKLEVHTSKMAKSALDFKTAVAKAEREAERHDKNAANSQLATTARSEAIKAATTVRTGIAEQKMEHERQMNALKLARAEEDTAHTTELQILKEQLEKAKLEAYTATEHAKTVQVDLRMRLTRIAIDEKKAKMDLAVLAVKLQTERKLAEQKARVETDAVALEHKKELHTVALQLAQTKVESAEQKLAESMTAIKRAEYAAKQKLDETERVAEEKAKHVAGVHVIELRALRDKADSAKNKIEKDAAEQERIAQVKAQADAIKLDSEAAKAEAARVKAQSEAELQILRVEHAQRKIDAERAALEVKFTKQDEPKAPSEIEAMEVDNRVQAGTAALNNLLEYNKDIVMEELEETGNIDKEVEEAITTSIGDAQKHLLTLNGIPGEIAQVHRIAIQNYITMMKALDESDRWAALSPREKKTEIFRAFSDYMLEIEGKMDSFARTQNREENDRKRAKH